MDGSQLEKETRILKRMLDGDRLSAAVFVRRFRGIIERTVRQTYHRAGIPPRPEDVEDAIHETWLLLFEGECENLRRFQPEQGKLTSWISMMARRRTIDRLRAAYSRRTCLGAVPEEASREPNPTEQLELQERCQLATRALNDLRREDRRFLEAWYLQGREPADLAAELGVTLTTVYTRRFKIQQKMARQVATLAHC
jgi:RNA polymerase sigma-70 factor (ECF subfamily)